MKTFDPEKCEDLTLEDFKDWFFEKFVPLSYWLEKKIEF